MTKLSSRSKMYGLIAAMIISIVVMFGFVTPKLEAANALKVRANLDKKKEMLELEEQQKSFQLGKADIDEMAKKELQPENFFSNDTSLVKEISQLEALATQNSLDLNLAISGNASKFSKANTSGKLLVAPYTMQLTGSYEGVVNFLQGIRELSFITHAQTLSIQNAEDGTVNAIITAVFYIKP